MLKQSLYWLGIAVSILALYWFIEQLISYKDIFLEFSLSGFFIVVACVFIYLLSIIIAALLWQLLIVSVGNENLKRVTAVHIVFISQFAKYLPGNIGHHVGRVILAREAGISFNIAVFSMLLELIIVLLVSSLLSILAFAILGKQYFEAGENQINLALVIFFISILSVLFLNAGNLFNRLVQWWAKKKGVLIQKTHMPRPGKLMLAFFFYTLNFILLGVIIKILGEYFYSFSGYVSIISLACIFSVAWTIGFLMPGSPAGLGIREVILVTLLGELFHSYETAVGVTALLRMVTIIGDGLVFTAGLGMRSLMTDHKASG